MKIFKSLGECLKKLDRWLCGHLSGRRRVWWSKLWIREDEFHPSLNPEINYVCSLSDEDRQAYWADLYRRRYIAHKQDQEKEDLAGQGI